MQKVLTPEEKSEFESRAKVVQETILKVLKDNQMDFLAIPSYRQTATGTFELIVQNQFSDLKYVTKPEAEKVEVIVEPAKE